MIPEKLKQVLEYEGVVAIATQGEEGPHLINTWNSYVHLVDDEYLLFPAGGMNKTETNINQDNNINLTIGSREVDGYHGKGTGFAIKGTAEFLKSGLEYDLLKESFPWARAAVKVNIESITQTL